MLIISVNPIRNHLLTISPPSWKLELHSAFFLLIIIGAQSCKLEHIIQMDQVSVSFSSMSKLYKTIILFYLHLYSSYHIARSMHTESTLCETILSSFLFCLFEGMGEWCWGP
ncbi:unnamed protein product [Ilex paraguariensis]|uniref:Uncharacterized protein n=1 Tax=Ilex paraguariensis TaxID=185542 RepID=A0ABC8TQK9_9AQUA